MVPSVSCLPPFGSPLAPDLSLGPACGKPLCAVTGRSRQGSLVIVIRCSDRSSKPNELSPHFWRRSHGFLYFQHPGLKKILKHLKSYVLIYTKITGVCVLKSQEYVLLSLCLSLFLSLCLFTPSGFLRQSLCM